MRISSTQHGPPTLASMLMRYQRKEAQGLHWPCKRQGHFETLGQTFAAIPERVARRTNLRRLILLGSVGRSLRSAERVKG